MPSISRSVVMLTVVSTALAVGCAPQPALVDLTVEALSIYTTPPDASGARQVTTSFRIVNHGASSAIPTIARVQVGNDTQIVGTPSLTPNATLQSTAYLS